MKDKEDWPCLSFIIHHSSFIISHNSNPSTSSARHAPASSPAATARPRAPLGALPGRGTTDGEAQGGARGAAPGGAGGGSGGAAPRPRSGPPPSVRGQVRTPVVPDPRRAEVSVVTE